ncbi:hypothetical protein D3C87_2032720 [compost metagenome]
MVFEKLNGFGTNALEEALLHPDEVDVDMERAGDRFFGNAAFNGLEDHIMLLDGRQPADPLIVGISFIIGGNEAIDSLDAQFL